MAAGKRVWQNYNFPFSDQENVSQSFMDYSSASVLNIGLDEHEKRLVIDSKQSHDSQLQRLVAKHPSLPFLEPNQRSSFVPEDTLNNYQLSGFLRRKQFNFDISTAHVDNFSAYHPDIMYSTATDLLQEEMNCFPWSTCGNMRHKIDVYRPWQRKEGYCKLCSNFRKASMFQDSKPSQVMKHLGTALPDVCPSLLESLLKESTALEIPRFHFDTFLGNSLSCHTLQTDGKALLVYPSGAGLDILNSSCITQSQESVDEESTSLPFEPILSEQQFSIRGQIRQIDCSSYSHNNVVVGTRSQYNCSFFQSCPNISKERNSLSLKPLETLALTKQAMCIAVSPYIPGEGVIVTETGATYLWRCGHALTTMCPTNQCDSSDDSPWYQCVFAANPRCIALADARGVDLLDFRAGALFRRFFFSIPSPQVDSFENISSIQRHPQNAHHYVVATDQSLMILDDRYLQHPVLKWRHHNEDPVQFISVTCNAFPKCEETVLVISGSNHGQTHCFQYSDSQVCTERSSDFITKQCYLPPQSTSLPWKVSSYKEWYHAGLSGDHAFSSAAASRLSQPLIGVCTMPHTSHPRKGFTVFQMSSAGDLFYQPFFSVDVRDIDEKQYATHWEPELGTTAKSFCQKWIDMTDQQMDDFVKTAPHQVDCVEVDKKDICVDLLSLPPPHRSCVLCNDKQNGELDHAKGDSSICERCGLDTRYSTKLLENRKNKKVLTSSSLSMSIQHEVRDLEIFPDFNKATDPLSKSLWVNWTSDEPIPVFSNEPVPVNVEEPILVSNNDSIQVVDGNKPISVNNNRQTPAKTEKLMPIFSSGERDKVENQSLTDINKASVSLLSQDDSLSLTVLSQADKRTNDNELKISPCKQVVPSTSQLQGVKNSPKKLKLAKKRTGHVMGF